MDDKPSMHPPLTVLLQFFMVLLQSSVVILQFLTHTRSTFHLVFLLGRVYACTPFRPVMYIIHSNWQFATEEEPGLSLQAEHATLCRTVAPIFSPPLPRSFVILPFLCIHFYCVDHGLRVLQQCAFQLMRRYFEH